MSDALAVLGLLTVSAMAGLNLGMWLIEKRYQREAVKRGFAEPAKPAEEWKWKEPTP